MLQNKYIIVILVFVIFVASANVAMTASISDLNNPHNLSSSATHGGPQAQPLATGGTDQICIFCHTPHSATPGTPLWSRPDPQTMGSFPLYNSALVIKGDFPGSSGTENISLYKNDGTYPSGSSRLCLSCHDGVTAMGLLDDGTFIAMAGGTIDLSGTQFQINLRTSHPISFVYNTAVLAAINGLRSNTYQLPAEVTAPAPLDSESKMQCTTCHDPHEDTSNDTSYDNLPFWRHQGDASSYVDVCNECHIGGAPTGPGGDHDPGPGI